MFTNTQTLKKDKKEEMKKSKNKKGPSPKRRELVSGELAGGVK
jgi:hypothetical protein